MENDITLAIIAKSEEKGLERAILSCRDFVDKIIISVDTESKDKTLEIAKKYADEVYTHVWESDFSKARNDLQKHVTTKWVLWLDGHEFVKACPGLKKELESDVDGLLIKIQMEDGFTFHFCRIIQKHAEWKRAVHNCPECPKWKTYEDFLIVHDRKNMQDKKAIEERFRQRNEMNFADLHKKIKENKRDVRSLFYLAVQYRTTAQNKKAIKYYKKYLKYSTAVQERWVACYEMARCATLLKKHRLALKFWKKAHKELPKRWEIEKGIGISYMIMNKWSKAIPHLVESFVINRATFLFNPELKNKAHTWFMIGYCFMHIKEDMKARTAFEKALSSQNESESGKLNDFELGLIEMALSKSAPKNQLTTTAEVCLVVYKRHLRVPQILKQLKDQTVQNFNVNIWNNSGENLDLGNFPEDRLQVITSKENVGSQARFKLVKKTTGNPIIFIDDDEELEPDFVEYNCRQYLRHGPSYVLGWFNRRFSTENYWQADLCLPYGVEVDYVGTGGMILDRKIFDECTLLQDMPPEFAKVEDIFLSYMARMEYGMKLMSIDKKCGIIPDEHDQYKVLMEYKQEAFNSLRKLGWSLLKDKKS